MVPFDSDEENEDAVNMQHGVAPFRQILQRAVNNSAIEEQLLVLNTQQNKVFHIIQDLKSKKVFP